LVPVFAVLAGRAVLSIPREAINLSRARDLDGTVNENVAAAPAGYGVLFKTRPLVIFGLSSCCFMSPIRRCSRLSGKARCTSGDAMMSACIAPLVMLPLALLVGHTAESWGRKPLFLLGFGILPIRAVLRTFSDDSAWLIGVQLLDGVGAGVFGALSPLVIADIMRGTAAIT
jgi:Na+/melibiose symporter-like transporter